MPNSIIFNEDFCTKTGSKASIVIEIENCLTNEDKIVDKSNSMHTEVIIDFMSSVGQIVIESEYYFADIVDKPI